MEAIINSWMSKFDRTLESLFYGIRLGYQSDESLISDEVLEIINNPNDKKKLDEALNYLQNHKTEKQREVQLSDRTITISIG